ncbi:MAG TPA: GyrI-like domain-containing protein [Clostridia bacterium]|nr:GyrI-like domain-containing protein [Clostridia bacterium]
METIDLRKQMKDQWSPPVGKVVLVTVPAMPYLVIEGVGNPNTSKVFQEAIQALYAAAYTMKFGAKTAGVADWKVMPMEALWWTTSGKDVSDADFEGKGGEDIAWKALLMQPAVVTAEMLEQAKAEVVRKKKDVPALGRLHLETWAEGLCVQTMYVGPYDGERPTIEMMHAWIATNGYRARGRHHELYISDPGRTAPERMKTILRLPVEKIP